MIDHTQNLQALVGDRGLAREASDQAPYLTDWMGRFTAPALAVVRPATVSDVQAVVRYCVEHRLPIVPQGGNTGLCGGAAVHTVPNAILLSTDRLKTIRQIDPDNNSMLLEAGVTLQAAQEAAASVDRMFPLSLASEGSCSVGGNLSTNAGGIHVLRYGNMRDQVLGLEVVLPTGELWQGARALRKDNTGYDLKQLFIGAEGTLGVVTAASLKLYAPARQSVTAWLATPTPQSAVKLLRSLQTQVGDRLIAFELLSDACIQVLTQFNASYKAPLQSPWHVLCEFTDAAPAPALYDVIEAALAAVLESGDATDGTIAQSEAQRKTMWHLREVMAEAQKSVQMKIRHDITLPISDIAKFIEVTPPLVERAFPGARVLCFGHLGDGNLHYNIYHPDTERNTAMAAKSGEVNRIVFDQVARMNGSISAEHGIGTTKRDVLTEYRSKIELNLMRALKRAWDPMNLMNPTKVITV